MLKNYIKIALRSFARNKSNTVINVIGLAVGIAACLLIFLVINYELSFDSFHHDKNNIYRVASVRHSPQGNRYSSGAPFPVAEALRLDYPLIKEVADIYQVKKAQIIVSAENYTGYKEKFIEEKGAFFCEPQFFDIFNFVWLAGSPAKSLAEPNTAILSKSTAEKYYGNWKAAVGRTIKFQNKYNVKVTGILDDVPAYSDFPLDVVVSYKTFENDQKDDWVSVMGGNNVYVLLPSVLNKAQFDSYLSDFVKKHKPPQYQKDGLIAQPLSDLHFDDRFDNFKHHTFNKYLITTLSFIGLFLLIIACVNFINLSTAQAVKRSLEVGIRKVLGSTRKQLAIQFMSEMALITVFSVITAVILAIIALPFLNDLIQTSIKMDFITNPLIILFLVAVTIVVTLFSGLYPSLVLSGFNPIVAIKGKMSVKTVGGIALRRGLVVTQFVIAQVLVIGVLIVISQMNYFRNAPLGFNKDSVLLVHVPLDPPSQAKFQTLKNRLVQQSDIKDVSYSTFSPSDDQHWDSDFRFNNSTKLSDFNADLKWADVDYFNMYGLKFVAGRPYTQTDTVREFVVNQTFLKKLGISRPENIIGKRLNFWGGILDAPIVGVIKDFKSYSLHDPVKPVVMGCWKENYELMNIKIAGSDVRGTLAFIKRNFDETFPNYVYESKFLDQKIQNFYVAETRLSGLYSIFAFIAIFISCLGLYGLVSFMAAQKTKEVGIRKVLGASTGNILYLFSKEFTILIIVAFLIASPIAYYVMSSWLADFAYRITPGVWLFLLTILGSLTIAWITVSYKAIKAAHTNPAKTLKYE